jgi:hypothetical protein
MGHVFARLTGHGLVLVPQWPYSFERPDPTSDAVMVTNWRTEDPATALIDPAADPRSVPGVVDVEPGPDHPFWVIETSGFDAVWPAGFSIESSVPPYCLVGDHESSISVQGPVVVADPETLVARNQRVIARRTMGDGVRVLEVTYEHEGEQWWQGLYLYPRQGGRVLVLAAQCLEPGIATTRHGVEWMLGLN